MGSWKLMGSRQVNFVRGLLQGSPLATGLQKGNGRLRKETTRECTIVFIPNLSKNQFGLCRFEFDLFGEICLGVLGMFFWSWQLKVGAMLLVCHYRAMYCIYFHFFGDQRAFSASHLGFFAEDLKALSGCRMGLLKSVRCS